MRAGKGRKSSGTSLIELIVSIALFVYLMMMVFWALVYCNQYLRNCETKEAAQTQALNALTWLSRSITESNVTAMSSASSAGIYEIGFPSPRDPGNGGVAFDTTSATGAIIWRQMMFVYLTPPQPDQVPSLQLSSFPLAESGGVTTEMTSGFPPYPIGAADLSNIASPLSLAQGRTLPSVLKRTISPDIRQLLVDIYNPADPTWTAFLATPGNSGFTNMVNMTIEGFSPYYGLNYGVIVKTQVRVQN